jgi:hypothetical protein
MEFCKIKNYYAETHKEKKKKKRFKYTFNFVCLKYFAILLKQNIYENRIVFGTLTPSCWHLIIANHMAENSDLDQVWLVVTPHNPF